ncbi:MAG: hypothetical protein GY953_06215, partial [bacterium]|nr:hypothetical protein [bacterium]
VEVSGGEIVALEGHQFSANDKIVGNNSWKLTNRRDETPGFARINYLEMSPAERPPTLHFPVSVFLTVRQQGDARVSVKTEQGDFSFRLSEIGDDVKSFLGGRASVARTATVQKLTTEEYEDDEAAIARLPNGDLATPAGAALTAQMRAAFDPGLEMLAAQAMFPPSSRTEMRGLAGQS